MEIDNHNDDRNAADGPEHPGIVARVGALAGRIESRYLSLLRYALLVIATLLLLVTGWLLGSGLVRQIGSSEVKPEAVALSISDIAPPVATSDSPAAATPGTPSISKDIAGKTVRLYRAAFQKHQRKEDKTPTDAGIVETVWPENLRQDIAKLDFAMLASPGTEGKVLSDAEAARRHLLSLVEKAAGEGALNQQLAAYRGTAKVRVCEDKLRSRQRQISSWDPFSTSCYAWNSYPYGCPSTRTVDEPYMENVCTMKFPEDQLDPLQLMAASARNYVEAAAARIEAAKNDAEQKRAEILRRKAEGRGGMIDSGKVFLGFLGLMLLYLLVAIERHYRTLARLVPPPEATEV